MGKKNKNNNNENNSLLYSLLISLESIDKHEVTFDDVLYKHFPKVTECQKRVYELVIEKMCEGLSFEELVEYIDKIDIEELKSLDDNQRYYVKSKAKKDIMTRKKNLEKREGENK